MTIWLSCLLTNYCSLVHNDDDGNDLAVKVFITIRVTYRVCLILTYINN